MPIHKPDRVLLQHLPFRFIRTNGAQRKSVDTAIPLVPFIDFLITLVVFLLSAFSATGEIPPPRGLVVPEAHNSDDLELAPVIAIDSRVITLDGRRMADTTTLEVTAQIERIDPLIRELETQRHTWEVIHPNVVFPGRVVIQADRSIDFRVMKKVLFSIGQAGYPNIAFAVTTPG